MITIQGIDGGEYKMWSDGLQYDNKLLLTHSFKAIDPVEVNGVIRTAIECQQCKVQAWMYDHLYVLVGDYIDDKWFNVYTLTCDEIIVGSVLI